MAEQKVLIKQDEPKETIYESSGETVTLTAETVRKHLVRGNAQVTNTEIIMFMSLCKYQQLNPFLNEAYLIKFKEDAQIVVGKETFMKRAEACEYYEGFEAGIIVERNGEEVDLEGCYMRSTDKLTGGWSKVHRRDRKYPFISRIMLSEYHKGQSTWNKIPSTMIRKVALVQALREAFPSFLGDMYDKDELVINEVDLKVLEDISQNANSEKIDISNSIDINNTRVDLGTGEILSEKKEPEKSKKKEINEEDLPDCLKGVKNPGF